MIHHTLGRRGRLLTLALWGFGASAAHAQDPQAPQEPVPTEPPPEVAPEVASPEATPEAPPPEVAREQVAVAIYGVPPTHDYWEVQGRVRASAPYMGLRTDVPFALIIAGAEVAVGPITLEGGYALRAGLHAYVNSPFFNLGAQWTYKDDYATGQGDWQGRAGALVGYDTVNYEYGEYGFERWHAISGAFALDATWWFTRAVGLELRLSAGVLFPISFKSFDSANVGQAHQIAQGSPYPYGLLTVGLAFGRWSIF
jgi:hypothetical protein